MPLIALGIGAGAGVLKNELVDKPQYNRNKYIAAETQRYSPWTGLHATAPNAPSMTGDVLQGALSGMQVGGAIQNAQSANNLQNAQANWLNSGAGGSPSGEVTAGSAAANTPGLASPGVDPSAMGIGAAAQPMQPGFSADATNPMAAQAMNASYGNKGTNYMRANPWAYPQGDF